MAPQTESQPARRPRVWPTLTVLGALLPALFGAAALAMVVALLLGPPGALTDAKVQGPWMSALLRTPMGLALVTLPTQLVLLAAASGPALLSPTAWLTRLGLRRWRVSHGLLALTVVGTIGLTLPVDLLMGALFGQPSEHLRTLVEAIRAPQGFAALFPLLMVGLLPGIAEELFFRGYVQTRLLQRWRPWLALGLPALLFSLLHGDPMHIASTLAPAAWLAWVAYRTHSVFTSMLCHCANNVVGVLIARSSKDPFGATFNLPPLLLMLLGATTVVLVVAFVALRRQPLPLPRDKT